MNYFLTVVLVRSTNGNSVYTKYTEPLKPPPGDGWRVLGQQAVSCPDGGDVLLITTWERPAP